jgi:hypothetical protein
MIRVYQGISPSDSCVRQPTQGMEETTNFTNGTKNWKVLCQSTTKGGMSAELARAQTERMELESNTEKLRKQLSEATQERDQRSIDRSWQYMRNQTPLTTTTTTTTKTNTNETKPKPAIQIPLFRSNYNGRQIVCNAFVRLFIHSYS